MSVDQITPFKQGNRRQQTAPGAQIESTVYYDIVEQRGVAPTGEYAGNL